MIRLLSLLPVLVLMACVTTDEVKSTAERNAKEYALSMQYDLQGVQCSGRDSDDDLYTSCTMNIKTDTGIDILAIECGYDVPGALLGQNTSCKTALPKVYTPRP